LPKKKGGCAKEIVGKLDLTIVDENKKSKEHEVFHGLELKSVGTQRSALPKQKFQVNYSQEECAKRRVTKMLREANSP